MPRTPTSLSALRRVTKYLLLAACALTALTASAFWWRSPTRFDYARWTTTRRHFLLVTIPHGLRFSTWPDLTTGPGLTLTSDLYFVPNAYGAWLSPPAADGSTLGFKVTPVQFTNHPGPEPRSAEVRVPFWAILLATLTPPALTAAGLVKRAHRRRNGHCPICGYNLRGTATACPECGAQPPLHSNQARA